MRYLIFCTLLFGCGTAALEERIAGLEYQNATLRQSVAKANESSAAATQGVPAAPALPPNVVALPAVLPAGAVIAAYPAQHSGYAYTPPIGWGQSIRSVVIESYLHQEVPGTLTDVPACWLGVDIDGVQVEFVRPNPFPPGSQPLLWNVVEGNTRRTITLLPPGVRGYVILNHTGIHEWRVRCYDGPPIQVEAQTADGKTITVPALELTGEMVDRGVNPNRIVAKNGYLHAVAGNLD